MPLKLTTPKMQRRWHKILSVFVGLQLLIWSLSGLYFSAFDIHDIHGENLLRAPSPLGLEQTIGMSFAEVLRLYPDAQQLRLKILLGEPHYQFSILDAHGKTRWFLLNAQNATVRPPLTETEVKQIATSRFSGTAPISGIEFLAHNAPSELASRHLPVWQVQFNDWQSSTFYIHPQTGSIVTKRHDRWRLFDIFWRLHILDINGEDVANSILTTMSVLALLMVITGVILALRFLRTQFLKRPTR